MKKVKVTIEIEYSDSSPNKVISQTLENAVTFLASEGLLTDENGSLDLESYDCKVKIEE